MKSSRLQQIYVLKCTKNVNSQWPVSVNEFIFTANSNQKMNSNDQIDFSNNSRQGVDQSEEEEEATEKKSTDSTNDSNKFNSNFTMRSISKIVSISPIEF